MCREAESAALAKSILKGSLKKMSAIQFKQELCLELLRCEAILKERLPAIIKVALPKRFGDSLCVMHCVSLTETCVGHTARVVHCQERMILHVSWLSRTGLAPSCPWLRVEHPITILKGIDLKRH